MRLAIDRINSPIGTIILVCDDAALCALEFADCEELMMRQIRARFGSIPLVEQRNPLDVSLRLQAYFGGELTAIDDVPANGSGTAFQRRVWRALRRIPAGTTSNYGRIAKRIGAPAAVRAVGNANGRNPVSIVVPCHRLIGADGSLVGYGGGIARKRWLLEHEGVDLSRPAQNARETA